MPLLYTKPLHQQPPGHAATPLCGASQNSQNGGIGKQAMRAPCETHTGGQKEAGNCSCHPGRQRFAQQSFLHQLPTAGNMRIKMLVCRKASAEPPTSMLFARYPNLHFRQAAPFSQAVRLFRMPFPNPFSQLDVGQIFRLPCWLAKREVARRGESRPTAACDAHQHRRENSLKVIASKHHQNRSRFHDEP